LGEVVWHSLEESGHVAIYDVRWESGDLERNIPASLLESDEEKQHEHQVRQVDTPAHQRNK
jgi:hypothetical protein